MDMVAFMQGGIGHIVSVNINTIAEKTLFQGSGYVFSTIVLILTDIN